MDALGTISLAGNVVQFVEYGIIAVTKAAQIFRNPDGKQKEDDELEPIANDVESSFQNIRSSEGIGKRVSESDKILNDLVDKCAPIAEEVDHILDMCIAKSPVGLLAIGKAAQRLPKQSELIELRGRLLVLRGQVSNYLIKLIRNEQQKLGMTLQTVVASNEDVRQRINDTHGEVMKYLKSISQQTTTTGSDDRKRIHRFSKKEVTSIHKDRASKIKDRLKISAMQTPFATLIDDMERLGEQKRQNILQTLSFDQLYDRELAVSEAHEGTAKWIFDETKPTNFVKWLRESNSVYWITGKAGSGKSTLIKFLTDHPKTLQYLKKWASGSDLVIAKHYFWSPGTSMQKSQEGLFRALLLQILRQRQELIPVVCADRWNAPYQDAFYSWTLEQLVEAFQRLDGLYDDRLRICLFIDGLDEYEGEPTELIDMIDKIGESEKIKICISSRPWKAFSDTFGSSQFKLELQDFTRGDIQQFIKGKLQNDDKFSQLRKRDSAAADGFVRTIAEKADGVFLWVFLVVRSLLRGLRDEDDISDLQRRLRELPDDLYKFFDNIFDTVEYVYREKVSRLFLTMTFAEATLPIITFFFLNFGDSPLSREPLPFLREWPNVDDEQEALKLEKQRLIAQCKDLIHIVSDLEGEVLFAEKVEFIHSTVFSFLRTKYINERLFSIAGKGFHPVNVLLQANIGQVRSLIHLHRLTYIKPYLQQWILGSLYYAHLIEMSDGTAEIDALDELEDIIMKEFHLWSFSHAMEYLLDMPQITSFLELACRCDLALYVCQKYPEYNATKLDELAPEWRMMFRIRQQGTFAIAVIDKDEKYNVELGWRLGQHLGLFSSQGRSRTRTESVTFSSRRPTFYSETYSAGRTKGKKRLSNKLRQLFRRR